MGNWVQTPHFGETLLTMRSTGPKLVEASGPKQWLNKHLHNADTQIYDPKTEVNDENERYCKRLPTTRCVNEKFILIQRWKSQSHHLPRLAKVAIDILSTPPISARAERVFSHCGNIVGRIERVLKPILLVQSFV